MASVILKTGQQLNYFDSLISQYRTSIASFSNNLLSSIPSNSNVTPSKISGTLNTGEMVVILGKFGTTSATITSVSITNPNTGTKITSSLNWTMTEAGMYNGEYGLSTAYFKGYSYTFTNIAGNKISITESFDNLMLDGSNNALTHYKFTITDGYGGSASITVESLSMDTYTLLHNEPSFANMINIIGADASVFSGNDILDSSHAASPQTMYGYEGNDKMTGSSGDDSLAGGAGDDSLTGGAGNDILDGGTGNDKMTGGFGNDTYYVDSLTDKVIESAGVGSGTDTIHTTVTLAKLVNNVENVTIDGVDTLNVNGNKLVNTIIGNDAANILNGKEGSDFLTGGAGNDTFVFNTKLSTATVSNMDTIEDFSTEDTIQLENAIFKKLSTITFDATTKVLNADFFTANDTGTAQDANDYIVFNTQTGVLSYDADGNGAGVAIQFATLTGQPTLSATDFTVI